MLKMIISIDEVTNECIEYNLDFENEEDASDLEMIAANDIIDLLDDMIDIVNEEDAKNTVKDICNNIGKQK